MMSTRKILLVITLVCCSLLSSRVMPAQDAFTQQIRQAMDTSAAFYRSIATHGGYAGIYSLDLQRRYGEALTDYAGPMDIWVQPPGTPTVGQAFLKAFKVTGDFQYLTDARNVARALAWGQCAEGGWAYKVNMGTFPPNWQHAMRRSGRCTLDDCTTQGCLEFLMDLDQVVQEPWLSEAVELGLSYIIRAQFPNGAWPQCYPSRGGFTFYYTFNDMTINDCIKIMLKAHQFYHRPEYLQSAKRGGDFIILSQLPKPQSGWAQQYDHDMKPAQARKFEPPAACSKVTAWNMKTLLDLSLYTSDSRYMRPIPDAITWLNASRIGPQLWAHFYELGTNKPIYPDKFGGIHYNLEEIPKERSTGDAWKNGPHIVNCIRYYEKVMGVGLKRYKQLDAVPMSSSARRTKAQKLKPAVEKAIDDLDKNGRWVRNNRLYIADFVKNFGNFVEYIDLTSSKAP